ncbi:MAG: RNAse R [Alteromonadaceae bacterium]|nr:MAG: RNAse R [Alteromonadaceae bacterium]
MLNTDVLSQLTKLKQDIQSSKEYANGVVASTRGRFGFVKLDDGRDAFLPAEKMQFVIAGDKVRVNLITNAKDKLEAELEALLEPALDRFIGQYRIKGGAHFVAPSGAQANRWIFIPPKYRGQCKEHDFIVARMLKHPFKDGKPSASIVEKIGPQDQARIEHKYTRAKYELNRPIEKKAQAQASALEKLFAGEDTREQPFSDPKFGQRIDATDRMFVTIDAPTTKDMDDAVCIEQIKASDGESAKTRVLVAIADPANFIEQFSSLATHSLQSGQSVYLLGGAVPMLPIELAHHCFSLEENKVRPALLISIDFNEQGDILDSRFEHARIKSHHKLSYDDVARFLQSDDEDAIPSTCQALIRSLEQWSSLRHQYREKHHIVFQDQADYEHQLDDQGKIKVINLKPRNIAHQIVEEAMLATNLCAGKLLQEQNKGLFSVHGGFRSERLGEVKALLKEEEIQWEGELNDLENHVALLKSLENSEQQKHLVAPLRRMMQQSQLSHEGKPHLGMGFPAYATVTSPIRRYADLYNHWAISSIVSENSFKPLPENKTTKLTDALQNGRLADRELRQWLLTQHTKSLIGSEGKGIIRIVTQQGFGVRLNDSGIEGFVAYGKNKSKTFDAKRMTLIIDDTVYYLGKEVDIVIASVDNDKRRVAFKLKGDDATEDNGATNKKAADKRTAKKGTADKKAADKSAADKDSEKSGAVENSTDDKKAEDTSSDQS